MRAEARHPLAAMLSIGALLAAVLLVVPTASSTTSLATAIEVAPPAPPSVVTKVGSVPYVAPKARAIKVRWLWQPDVTSYRVQRATNATFTKGRRSIVVDAKKKQPARGSQQLKLKKLKRGKTYWFRVRAIDSEGRTGPWSAAGRATTTVKVKKSRARFTVKPGKKPGTVRFRWKKGALRPAGYVLVIASSMFYPGTPGRAQRGRKQQTIKIRKGKSSYTVSAKKAKKAGVPKGSGETLYYRFTIKYPTSQRVRTQLHAGLGATLTAPVKPPKKGTKVRVATYNVASAGSTAPGSGVGRPWYERAKKVARIINDSGVQILGIQELSPGNQVNGRAALTYEPVRQTENLLKRVNAPLDRAPWRLVRTTSYVPPGHLQGTQGARILYDSTKYTLLSDCVDAVPSSTSCTIRPPILATDTLSYVRRAAYAKFRDKRTKAEFWFVSAHLDHRRGATVAEQKRYDTLRKRQAKKITKKIKKINTEKLPIIFTADLNGWQNDVVSGNPAHRVMLSAGYYDASATKKRSGTNLLTTTSWRTTIPSTSTGLASRIDYIMVRGVKGSLSYTNTMVASDSQRGSDHALVMATLRLPKQGRS